MAKRTAIIDIGSNSARMAVFEKTSRFGFHLIKEIKSPVRVGEGAYEKSGVLQPQPMKRAYDTLKEFSQIIKNLKCRKTICVATSALRDAPNSHELTNKIKKELGLNIKIIDGKKEAYYGGIAALNLLAPRDEATTIDIGGGSTELAKIKNGKVIDTISLNLGTVRLKELFFDTKKDKNELERYINDAVSLVPKHFASQNIYAIGGTLRALSKSIMGKEVYPLKTVHGFRYEYEKYESYIKEISASSVLKLKSYSIKKDRYDTFREGCSIFYLLAKYLNAKEITTSGIGVREGVYLCDLLRSSNHVFPKNFNPSVKSFSDRFIEKLSDGSYVSNTAEQIFNALLPLHDIDKKYLYELKTASKLYNTGRILNFYQYHYHGFYFILNALNYGFTHEEKILIALLVKYHSKKLPKTDDLNEFKRLLPDADTINWLSFILSFAKSLNVDLNQTKCEFEYKNNALHVSSERELKLAKEAVKKLTKPASFAIIFTKTERL